ncbi:hypothetical protein MPSEU_000281800 [Mayamaea pseudoterrestris]|nr:hypothetical protein MPSEU_000281800 [Mayamaea pseudoterrestris]
MKSAACHLLRRYGNLVQTLIAMTSKIGRLLVPDDDVTPKWKTKTMDVSPEPPEVFLEEWLTSLDGMGHRVFHNLEGFEMKLREGTRASHKRAELFLRVYFFCLRCKVNVNVNKVIASVKQLHASRGWASFFWKMNLTYYNPISALEAAQIFGNSVTKTGIGQGQPYSIGELVIQPGAPAGDPNLE